MRNIMVLGLILALTCCAGYVQAASVYGLHNIMDSVPPAVSNPSYDTNQAAQNNQAIAAAITAAIADHTGVYFPSGTYWINGPITVNMPSTQTISQHITLKGEYAVIKAGTNYSPAATGMLQLNSTNGTSGYLHIDGFYLDCGNTAYYGIMATSLVYRSSIIENVAVVNAHSHGFYLTGCECSVWRNCTSNANGGSGWNIVGCNDAIIDSCAAISNSSDGFTIGKNGAAPGNDSGSCILTNFYSYSNSGNGVTVSALTTDGTVTINNGWIENNTLDGINIQSCGVYVTACQILGAQSNGSTDLTSNKAIRIGGPAIGAQVSGCYLYQTNTGSFYPQVRYEESATKNTLDYTWIQGNFMRSDGTYCTVESYYNGTATTINPTNWHQ